MKILYIHSTQIDSSKANLIQVISMCNAFEYNNVSVELLLPEPNQKIKDVNLFIETKFGIELNFKVSFYQRFSKNRIIEKYFGVCSVKKAIKKSEADYIFTRLPKFINPIIKSGKKIIFESHNNILHNKYPLIDRYWKKKILNNIKKENFISFISISQNLSDYWTELGIPKKKQMSLHDGFSNNLFEGIESKISLRKELKIPVDQKVAMYIGSLYPDREIENILLAAKDSPRIMFYIVGGPKEYENHYKNMAIGMGLTNVKFLGRITHNLVPKYLKIADYLLGLWSRKVPTINYCSPLKVFEYMASGNLVIVHDFPTIREVLSEGKEALFVNPDDKSDLAHVLSKAENMDTTDLRINCKKKAYEDYTWEKRAEKIIKNLS